MALYRHAALEVGRMQSQRAVRREGVAALPGHRKGKLGHLERAQESQREGGPQGRPSMRHRLCDGVLLDIFVKVFFLISFG